MKAVILAGGFGTRISEESHLKPKPMITIGEQPILWHIMKIFYHQGIKDFLICLGYKGEVITDYFVNYAQRNSDLTLDFSQEASVKVTVRNSEIEKWRVTLVNTGYNTMTGGRLFKCRSYLEESPFMMTYGDGVGNIDIKALLKFHKEHGKTATVTSVSPEGRFGALELNSEDKVMQFKEKPNQSNSQINAGFFVFQPQVFDYIKGDIENCVFEREPMESLAHAGELFAYKHTGYWKPMDTLRDKRQLEEEWNKENCAWKLW